MEISFLFWRLKIMYLEGSYLHWPLRGFPRASVRKAVNRTVGVRRKRFRDGAVCGGLGEEVP